MTTWAHTAPAAGLWPAARSSAAELHSAVQPPPVTPSAALLSFIADLPHYPRHLYSRSQQPTTAVTWTGTAYIDRHTTARPHSAAALVLATTHSKHTIRAAAPGEGGGGEDSGGISNRHLPPQQRRARLAESHCTFVSSAPSDSGKGQTDSSRALLSHRPLRGTAEQQHQQRQEEQHDPNGLQSGVDRKSGSDRQSGKQRSAPLGPLDFLLTQQLQRRQAAAHRREQMRWLEQHSSRSHDGQSTSGVFSRAMASQSRSTDRKDRRKDRERLERQAAQHYGRTRQTRQQAERGAAREWNQQTAAAAVSGLMDDSTTRDATAKQREEKGEEREEKEDELVQRVSGVGEAISSQRPQSGGEEKEQAEETARGESSLSAVATSTTETAAGRGEPWHADGPSSGQQSQPESLASLSSAQPSGLHPPLLSLTFVLSCLPSSCEGVEWAALCLSYLPLRAEPLSRLADFLSAVHSLLHITHGPPHTTTDRAETAREDDRLRPAAEGEPDTLSVAWLNGLLPLPSCIFLPLQDVFLPPQQQQQQQAVMPASLVDSGQSGRQCDSSACCVSAMLSRHYGRLCEWRWPRRGGPSVDQLLHLLHIVAHKVEVDTQSRIVDGFNSAELPPTNGSGGRVRPQQRFVDMLRSSLTERRPLGAPSASQPLSRSATVSLELFVALFSCLFGLASFPSYRDSATVCASIERVFTAVLPVSVDERAEQQRLTEQSVARAAEAERRAAMASERAVEAEKAEQRTLRRLEERRQREAAILSLHPRAGEWSGAAVGGALIRALPPHPLPPLPLTRHG